MRLLLDTHVFLWAAAEPARLTAAARAAIQDGNNAVVVSAVTGWEVAIKQALGKLTLPSPAEQWVPEVLQACAFGTAPVDMAAALRLRALPPHHRDPFDRMLIAQALESGLTVVTHDRVFEAYGVSVLAT